MSKNLKNKLNFLHIGGSVLAYIHVLFYATILYYTFGIYWFEQKCTLPIAYSCCLMFLIALLMIISVCVLLELGIRWKSKRMIRPWLCSDPIIVAIGSVLIFYTEKPMKFVLAAVIAYYSCIAFWVFLIIMIFASLCLDYAVQMKFAPILLPWLFLTPPIVIAAFVLWFYTTGLMNILMAVVLAYYSCIGFMFVLLLMLLASMGLDYGIRSKSTAVLLVWLSLTPPFVLIAIVVLFYTSEPVNFIIVLVIVLGILFWYPILKIYLQLSGTNGGGHETQPHETHDLRCIAASVLKPITEENIALSARGVAQPTSYNAVTNVPGSNPLQYPNTSSATIASDETWPLDMEPPNNVVRE